MPNPRGIPLSANMHGHYATHAGGGNQFMGMVDLPKCAIKYPEQELGRDHPVCFVDDIA